MIFKYKFINIRASILFLALLVLISLYVYNSIYKTSLLKLFKEGFTEEKIQGILSYSKNAEINYADLNSPLYSHTVNLPINDPLSCKNFCGPKAQCAITREQCTSDIDCFGCNPTPILTPNITQTQENIMPYDATGKLGQNQGLQYSSLTTGYNGHNADFAEVYDGSKDAQLTRPYEGVDNWEHSFNIGLNLYNKKRESADKNNEGVTNAIPLAYKSKLSYYEPQYPLSISATGLFYETTPPASNATL